MTAQAQSAKTGDVIVIEGHHLGESRRTGEILEVLGGAGHEHYRVRWEDGRETVFYPSNDATIHGHAAVPRQRRR
jgi:ribosomal protein L4